MSKRKRYTDDFRASAVLMLEAAGYTGGEDSREGSLMAVSKKLKVSHVTLRRWFHRTNNPPPSYLVQEKKLDLKKELTELLGLHIKAAKTAVDDAGLGDIDRGIGILFDKLQLLDNKPTAILELQNAIENGSVTVEQARERWPALMEKYDSISA